MAYNKRTWVGRQGTGLNKFSINGATPVTVVNQPDSVTEQGDALSAGNLNDLENRIGNAFDEADMRIADNSQHIINIETALTGTVIQEHVDSTQVNVKTILSADTILPWAIMKRVGARATQFNQLVRNGNFASNSDWSVPNPSKASLTISNNTAHVVVTDAPPSYDSWTVGLIQQDTPAIPSGHKWLCSFDISCSDGIINMYSQIFSSSGHSFNATTTKTTISWIDTQNDGRTSYIIYPNQAVSNGFEYDVSNFIIYDLTSIFGAGNEPNLATIQSDYAWMLKPSDFNAGSLIDLPPTSFLCRGTNQWDEVAELTTLAGNSCVASKNFIRVIPSTTYFLYVGNNYVSDYGIVVVEYDADGNVLKQDRTYSTTLTVSANTAYIKIGMISGYYGTTYKNDVMVCLNSVTDKTYKPYVGQTIDTSFMSDCHYINSSCYDYAENVYVNGVLKRKKQKVGHVLNLDDYSWELQNDNGTAIRFYAMASVPACSVSSNNINSFAEGGWNQGSENTSSSTTYNALDIRTTTISINILKTIFTGTTSAEFNEWVVGKTIYYELATLPDPTYGDPIPNFPCEDGATITAITPQTELVNAIDVPSTIVYGTKISA